MIIKIQINLIIMTTFTCDKCSKKFNSHKILLEHDMTCKKKIKYNSDKAKPVVKFAQKDFYRLF